MIYRHKRTGENYRIIARSFSVERQKPSVVYMKLGNNHTIGGEIFDRDEDKFDENFEYLFEPQEKIIPKVPHS